MTDKQKKPKTPRWWNDRTLFLYHFSRSNYVTAIWNWFMGLAGKAAEPFLFASVLYSGYKLLPGVPQPNAGVDAAVFIAQQATLDIGGMGLMKLAQQANQDKHSFAYRVGFILVGLMIANVIVASIARLVPLGDVGTVIEGILLVARAIMAVLYGHAVHALRGDAHESIEVVKSVDIHERLAEYTATLRQVEQANEQQLQRIEKYLEAIILQKTQGIDESVRQIGQATGLQLRQIESHLETVVSQKTQGIDESVQRFTGFQQGQISTLNESLSNLETGFQEYIDERLSESLAPIVSTLENHAEVLALLPLLTEQLGQTTRLVTEEVTKVVKVTLEQHTFPAPRLVDSSSVPAKRQLQTQKKASRPRLQAPAHKQETRTALEANGRAAQNSPNDANFDRKQFVYSCLEENPTLTIKEIQDKAAEIGQTLSIGCVSGHRSTFFKQMKEPNVKVVESVPGTDETANNESEVVEVETVLVGS